MKNILVVVDMQNDFITGVLGSKYAMESVLPSVRERLGLHLAAGGLVVFTQDSHTENECIIESMTLPAHCIKGTAGWEIASELQEVVNQSGRSANCHYLCKTSFASAAELTDRISGLVGDDDFDIAFCGLCTDICVICNALACRTKFPDKHIVVHSQLCGGTSFPAHEAALMVLKNCLVEVD